MIEVFGEELIFNGITQVGFPIVAFYLMYDFSKKSLQKNTDAVNNLTVWLKENK